MIFNYIPENMSLHKNTCDLWNFFLLQKNEIKKNYHYVDFEEILTLIF